MHILPSNGQVKMPSNGPAKNVPFYMATCYFAIDFVPVSKSKYAQWAIKGSVAHLHAQRNTMNLITSDPRR